MSINRLLLGALNDARVEDLGKDSDSSSLILGALDYAGYEIGGATHSGNMLSNLKKNGFVDVTSEVDLETGEGLIDGDILLTPKKMTALFIEDNGACVIQYDNETEKVVTSIYYNLPWVYVLRCPVKEETPAPEIPEIFKPKQLTSEQIGKGNKAKIITKADKLNVRKRPNGSIIGSLNNGDIVYLGELENGFYKLTDGKGYVSANHIKFI